MNTDTHHAVLDRLTRSQTYQDYERAFGEATGLPLKLVPIDDWKPTQSKQRHASSLCTLLAKQSKTCAACLRTRAKLADTSHTEAKTIECFAGLSETAIPLRIGENLIGFLRTGEVMLRTPTEQHFAHVSRQLVRLGIKVDAKELREAYFESHVLSPRQYEPGDKAGCPPAHR